MLDMSEHLDWSHVVYNTAFITNYWCNYQNATSPVTVGIHKYSHTGSTGASFVVRVMGKPTQQIALQDTPHAPCVDVPLHYMKTVLHAQLLCLHIFKSPVY